jgi:hypothetical protein
MQLAPMADQRLLMPFAFRYGCAETDGSGDASRLSFPYPPQVFAIRAKTAKASPQYARSQQHNSMNFPRNGW